VRREKVSGAEGIWWIVGIGSTPGRQALQCHTFIKSRGDFVHDEMLFSRGQDAHIVPMAIF
jgi:hypothetical protein